MTGREEAVRILQGLAPITRLWTEVFLAIGEAFENASTEIKCFSDAFMEFAAVLDDEP